MMRAALVVLMALLLLGDIPGPDDDVFTVVIDGSTYLCHKEDADTRVLTQCMLQQPMPQSP